jgi:hypothetical protein
MAIERTFFHQVPDNCQSFAELMREAEWRSWASHRLFKRHLAEASAEAHQPRRIASNHCNRKPLTQLN